MNLLVVEDEHRLATLVQRVLMEERYKVTVAYDGAIGLEHALTEAFDLLILDLMLPEMDGMAICRHLRSLRIQTPILMLTARDSVEDRVAGLRAGADDYLIKPFAMTELLARIDALLRRSLGTTEQNILKLGDLTMELTRHHVQRGDRDIDLTVKEFALLEFLMRHPGQVLSRLQILNAANYFDNATTTPSTGDGASR